MDYIIATSNLTKSYKEKVVVDKVNLHVKKGEIYGFVGPNGAGKSTIMKMLLNLVRPDSGEIYIFGEKMDYGATIFISSHILSEVEQIADRIGVIAGGKLLKEISIHEVHEYQTEYIEIDTDNVKQAACLLEQDERLSHFDVVDDTIIRIYSTVVSGKEISALLVKNGVGLESIGQKENSLEDYFFQLTKEGK